MNDMDEMKKEHNGSSDKNKRKLKPKAKITIIILAALLIIGIIAAILINNYIDSKIGKIVINNPQQTETSTSENKDPEDERGWEASEFIPGTLDENGIPCISDTEDVLNILIIGDDARPGEKIARSDTNILVTVNKKTKEINMASFLRDTVVELPNGRQNRLNVAYSYNGFESLQTTLKKNFNISVDYYVSFNFFSFVDIVDAVGGLDIELSAAELDVINFYLLETNEIFNRPKGTDNLPLKPDTYHLNGYQALGYARNRYSPGLGYQSGSDFVRTTRQRKVISMIVDKIKDMSFSEIDNLLNVALPKVTTNMSRSLIKQLTLKLPIFLTYNVDGFNVPQDGFWHYDHVDLGGDTPASVIQADKKACIEALYQKIYKTEIKSESN